MGETEEAPTPRTHDPVTETVFVETPSFESGPLDDEDALKQFIEDHKTKIKVDTAVMTDKQHVIGQGITYTFRADHK